MLNALWFRPEGGAERYGEYGEAVLPIMADVGADLLFPPMVVEQSLEGGFDPDLVVFVRYPSADAFEAMWRSDAYQKIAHLRTEAITRAVLTRCAIEPPDAEANRELPAGVAVLNALWFNEGGDATYDRYLEEAQPLVTSRGGQFLRPRLRPQVALGDDFVPDLVFLGHYPSIETLFEMIGSDEYRSPAATRSAAVNHSTTSILRVR